MRATLLTAVLLGPVLLCACDDDGSPSSDAGIDATADATEDTSIEDASPDATEDAEEDAAADAGTDAAVPTLFTALSAGTRHACALDTSGTAWCWGRNQAGQLGDGTVENDATPAPVTMPAAETFTTIAAGGFHTCAVAASANVYCWGYNATWQLGIGSTDDTSTPTLSHSTAANAAAGLGHTCIVDPAGSPDAGPAFACWGANDYGQVGNASTVDEDDYALVVGGEDAAEIAAGEAHSCGVHTDRTVSCWGLNLSGQLGTSTGIDYFANAAEVVDGIATATTLAVGGSHSCALLQDQTVSCWGDNGSGEVGIDLGTSSTSTATSVAGVTGATAICAGRTHSCAVLGDGTALCWGGNDHGALGDGSTTGGPTPVTVTGLDDATAVACGADFTCALREGRTVVCWGRNDYGQLGDGSTDESTTPVEVAVD